MSIKVKKNNGDKQYAAVSDNKTLVETIPNKEEVLKKEDKPVEVAPTKKVFKLDSTIKSLISNVSELEGDMNSTKGADTAFSFLFGVNIVINSNNSEKNVIKDELANLISEFKANDELLDIDTLGGADLKWSKDQESKDAYVSLVTYLLVKSSGVGTLTEAGVRRRFSGKYSELGNILAEYL